MASGRSAAIVSRILLPLSQVSTCASISRFSSIRSAIFIRTALRSAIEVFPQAGAASCAASSASSISAAFDRGIIVIGLPLTGDMSSKYSPFVGATH
jgi:hypothetical protein